MANKQNQTDESPAQGDQSTPWRRRLRIGLMIAGPIVLVAAVVGYYYAHRGHESTKDAFIKANIVQVSPSVAGRVVALPVHDYQQVHEGDVLIKLDPATFQAALAAARARLVAARNQVGALKAQYQALTAHIDGAKSHARYLAQQVQQNRPLAKRGIITHAKLDSLQTQHTQAQKRVTTLQAQRRQVLAQLGGNPEQPVKDNAAWQQARAALKQARINLDDTVVRAPADGRLGHVGIRVGDRLHKGEAAFPLVETGLFWVKANFKETALTQMRPGQPATIRVDSYPNQSWSGHVARISPASGGEFSLLPPQNATGNWVKVVQRIPVRITLDNPDNGPQLRAGMSAEVTVDVAAQPDSGG